MAVTGWSDTNYLRRAAQVINAYPLMVSCWFNRQTTAAVREICASGNTGATGERIIYCRVTATHTLQAHSASTSVYPGAGGTTVLTQNVWGHGTFEIISEASRAILTDGSDRQFNTTAHNVPTASNAFYVGRAIGTGEPCGADEGIAEISGWDCSGMTTGNMDALGVKLAAGENPINVDAEAAQPWTGRLVMYYPLTSTTDLTDASLNGHDLSVQGSVSNFASHPDIDAVAGVTPLTFTGTSDLNA